MPRIPERCPPRGSEPMASVQRLGVTGFLTPHHGDKPITPLLAASSTSSMQAPYADLEQGEACVSSETRDWHRHLTQPLAVADPHRVGNDLTLGLEWILRHRLSRSTVGHNCTIFGINGDRRLNGKYFFHPEEMPLLAHIIFTSLQSKIPIGFNFSQAISTAWCKAATIPTNYMPVSKLCFDIDLKDSSLSLTPRQYIVLTVYMNSVLGEFLWNSDYRPAHCETTGADNNGFFCIFELLLKHTQTFLPVLSGGAHMLVTDLAFTPAMLCRIFQQLIARMLHDLAGDMSQAQMQAQCTEASHMNACQREALNIRGQREAEATPMVFLRRAADDDNTGLDQGAVAAIGEAFMMQLCQDPVAALRKEVFSLVYEPGRVQERPQRLTQIIDPNPTINRSIRAMGGAKSVGDLRALHTMYLPVFRSMCRAAHASTTTRRVQVVVQPGAFGTVDKYGMPIDLIRNVDRFVATFVQHSLWNTTGLPVVNVSPAQEWPLPFSPTYAQRDLNLRVDTTCSLLQKLLAPGVDSASTGGVMTQRPSIRLGGGPRGSQQLQHRQPEVSLGTEDIRALHTLQLRLNTIRQDPCSQGLSQSASVDDFPPWAVSLATNLVDGICADQAFNAMPAKLRQKLFAQNRYTVTIDTAQLQQLPALLVLWTAVLDHFYKGLDVDKRAVLQGLGRVTLLLNHGSAKGSSSSSPTVDLPFGRGCDSNSSNIPARNNSGKRTDMGTGIVLVRMEFNTLSSSKVPPCPSKNLRPHNSKWPYFVAQVPLVQAPLNPASRSIHVTALCDCRCQFAGCCGAMSFDDRPKLELEPDARKPAFIEPVRFCNLLVKARTVVLRKEEEARLQQQLARDQGDLVDGAMQENNAAGHDPVQCTSSQPVPTQVNMSQSVAQTSTPVASTLPTSVQCVVDDMRALRTMQAMRELAAKRQQQQRQRYRQQHGQRSETCSEVPSKRAPMIKSEDDILY